MLLSPSFGPLFRLKLGGMLCPCLQRSEDASARRAADEIDAACRRVRLWWRGGRGENAPSPVRSALLLGSWLGGRSSSAADEGERNGSARTCLARLTLRDDPETSAPELCVNPADDSFQLRIKLRRVDKVSLDGDHIVLTAKPVDGQQPPKELLRFLVLRPEAADEGDSALPCTRDERNMLVHHLQVVAEWERQRRERSRAAGEEDGEEDEDDDQPNFLAARARRAAHFAARELEMREARRDRERRKAELVAGAGGMRYTALAMASRED